jgi:hypothetical protein
MLRDRYSCFITANGEYSEYYMSCFLNTTLNVSFSKLFEQSGTCMDVVQCNLMTTCIKMSNKLSKKAHWTGVLDQEEVEYPLTRAGLYMGHVAQGPLPNSLKGAPGVTHQTKLQNFFEKLAFNYTKVGKIFRYR